MTWYVEEGIGEDRAILIEHGEIAAARIEWPGALAAGQVEDALLVSRVTGSKRGTVAFRSGEKALVDRLPRDASEGAAIRVKVVRAAMAEAGRYKRAWCRPTDELPCPAPSLADALRAAGETVEVVRQFPAEGWEDVAADALTGTIDFAGGILIAALTPAMTVIDIDGSLPPRELAIAGAQATAKAIRRLDLAGSIGIDFPTLGRKEDRRAVDEALARALGSWPHERTAMNGFGFVQIVARLERPSLLHRFTQDRTGAAARMALRRAERVSEPGDLLVTVHPAVRMAMDMGWESDLRRRTGRDIRWQVDPGIALEAGFAQAVAR